MSILIINPTEKFKNECNTEFSSLGLTVESRERTENNTVWKIEVLESVTPQNLDAIEKLSGGTVSIDDPDYDVKYGYIKERQEARPSIGDQLDMIYKDTLAGTTQWTDTITAIKTAYPKPEEIK